MRVRCNALLLKPAAVRHAWDSEAARVDLTAPAAAAAEREVDGVLLSDCCKLSVDKNAAVASRAFACNSAGLLSAEAGSPLADGDGPLDEIAFAFSEAA